MATLNRCQLHKTPHTFLLKVGQMQLNKTRISEWSLLICRARATALEKGLNAILEPLLAEVEDILTQDHTGEECSNAPKEEEDTGIISWRTASLTDLPMLVSLACENLAARGDAHNIGTPATIKEATSAMLLVLHAICIAGENLEVTLSPSRCSLTRSACSILPNRPWDDFPQVAFSRSMKMLLCIGNTSWDSQESRTE